MRRFTLALLAALTATVSFAGLPEDIVHYAYVVPSNRAPQASAVAFGTYYLVAPLGGTVEGSYGTDSDRTPPPVGNDVCVAPRILTACP